MRCVVMHRQSLCHERATEVNLLVNFFSSLETKAIALQHVKKVG